MTTKTISNPKRGCGHLKPQSMYLRSDAAQEGILPAIVLFKEPIPCNELHFRGPVQVNGLQWEQALHPETFYPVAVHTQAKKQGFENYDDLYDKRWAQYSGGQTAPPTELQRHIARLAVAAHGIGKGEPDIGHSDELWASDLLMWVGKENYKTPAEFWQEGIKHGFNKRIRGNGTPPMVLTGRTKLYLAHPFCLTADGGSAPGVFGFIYLTSVIFTLDPGDALPKYADDLVATSKIEAVYIGPQGSEGLQPAPLLK